MMCACERWQSMANFLPWFCWNDVHTFVPRLWVNCDWDWESAAFYFADFLIKELAFVNSEICIAVGVVCLSLWHPNYSAIMTEYYPHCVETSRDTNIAALQRQPIHLLIYLSAFYLSLTHKTCGFCNNTFSLSRAVLFYRVNFSLKILVQVWFYFHTFISKSHFMFMHGVDGVRRRRRRRRYTIIMNMVFSIAALV